jgi:hypothetical protein
MPQTGRLRWGGGRPAVLRDRGTIPDLYPAATPSVVVEAAMATKITVALEDNLDGGPADEVSHATSNTPGKAGPAH